MAEAILRLLRLAEAIERPPEALAELCCKYPSKGASIYYVNIFSDIFWSYWTFFDLLGILELFCFSIFLDFLRHFFPLFWTILSIFDLYRPFSTFLGRFWDFIGPFLDLFWTFFGPFLDLFGPFLTPTIKKNDYVIYE